MAVVVMSIVATVVVFCLCLRKFFRKLPQHEYLVGSDMEDNEFDEEHGSMNHYQEEAQVNLIRRTSYKTVT